MFTGGSYHKPPAYIRHLTLIKGSQPVEWTPTMVHAFKDCKASPSRATLLAHPYPPAMLAIFKDASDTALGAALQQRVGDVCKPWRSISIRSTQLYKSIARTTESSWQCMRPSNTSAIWSKAGPSSYLQITSLSFMLSSNVEINAIHGSSVYWTILY